MNMEGVLIREARVGKKGARGVMISLPKAWAAYAGIRAGDTLGLFQQPGSDDLIVRKMNTSTSGQNSAREDK